ncbi:group II intron reverse transcriptase/maturase [Paraburkholderia hospita]|nr:group II intron reverse transcriptase/maturase [Paraburkholderia hospita]
MQFALTVPTVSDRIAQTVVKLLIEPLLDPIFHEDSYGYRPGKSAKQAIAVTRERCWKYDWVVEFDIKAAFDQIDHGLLLKAVRKHIKADWILLYIERWLTAPFETADGARLPRVRGTPQGGVVSPILMNLFMHYAFDAWMQRHFPQCLFARYADDAVVHCRSETQAQEVMHAIASRLAECGLQLHPEKSKIVYCKDRSRNEAYPNVIFTFLGFLFRPRRVLTKSGWLSTSFLPGVSPAALKRMRQAARRWRLPRQTSGSLVDLAEQCNPTIRGWWNYYGAFYRTAMHGLGQYLDRKLVRWAQRKYKTLRRHKRRSDEWLHKMKKAYPRQFVHWQFQGAQVG